jgi:hypothetical protein
LRHYQAYGREIAHSDEIVHPIRSMLTTDSARAGKVDGLRLFHWTTWAGLHNKETILYSNKTLKIEEIQ